MDETKVTRSLTLWQFVVAVLALCMTVAGMIAGGIMSLRAELAQLQQTDAITVRRIDTLEAKTRDYDRLAETRNQQYIDIKVDLAQIRALLERDREGRKP